jgi:DNA-binding MarR family transcriptional regulator
MRALQTVLEDYDAAASQRTGLGRNDWRCVRMLVETGAARPSAIQAALGLTSGSVTALLDRLERRNLVQRAHDASDRRALLVYPTQAARSLFENAHAPLSQVTARLSERLGEDRSAVQIKQFTDCARLVEWAGAKGM